jgi:nucleoside-diphosphate-sugar epimerase
MKKILVLGGGQFLGYWIAKVLELSGYELAFFNSGNNTPKLFPNFFTKVGDRRSYENKNFFSRSSFDIIIDTSAFCPADLALTKYLEHSQYIFISSVAVYSKSIPLNSNESADKIIREVKFKNDTLYTYGELKLLTEFQLQMISKNLTILRPAIILGNRDNTNRLSTYVNQSKNHMILPKLSDMPFQYIDVFDVANFVKVVIEKKMFGEFNITNKSISRDKFFLTLANIKKKSVSYTEHYESRLYPLHEDLENSSLRTLSSNLALKNGLKLTPLEQTLCEY